MSMVASTVVRHLCAEIASIAHRTVSEGVAWQAGMLVLQDGSRRRFVAPALRTLPLGSEVEVSGTMEVHPQHGEQLRVLECHRVRPPTSPDGLKRFLAANITGLGATRAQRILSVLGTSAIDVLKADPVRLESIFPGLVGRQLVEAWRRWMRTEEADEAAIDIATSLTSAGVTYKTARRIVSFFRSPELADLILNEHPYRLMDVPGLGWERADALARKLGFAPDHPERLRAAAVHAMERAQANGHSALPVEELAEFVSELVGADHAEPAVTLALDAAEIVEDGERSYLPASLEAEWTIASRLRRHLMASLRMTTREESKVDDVLARAGLSSAQEAAVRRALVSGCFILTGGPGTGKTSTLRAYVECLRSLGKTVRVAAPTGKAAARANEVVGGLAETIHRMIGGPPGSPRATPVEADALVIEETSMCSLEVFSWLLSSLRPTTQLLLVGDVEQLPSVDHGAILRDLLFSRTIPSARLTEVFRQAEGSSIINNAHRALAGAELVSDRHSFLIVDVSAPTNEGQVARALNRLMDALDWLIQSEGVAPATDLQVLSPLKRGPLGVEKLNVLLQGKLNPHGRQGPRIGGGARVRVGDRVFQMRNDYTLGESGVFNGEQGVVRAVGPDRVLVGWGDGCEIVVEGFRRYNLELGWATTVHRAQGSEFPNVLGLFTRTHGTMLSRPILYTAITRARERFIMITDDVARSRLREADQDGQARHTGLVRHLRQRLPEVA